ncbi:MAG: 50S ribosomal protein L20 [bacterium]|nr:50S ribosomal protein L20 [bacterium]MDZ4231714.1 50S ribosomal protein L20 [Candidatus Pacearchaeota archaeon]
MARVKRGTTAHKRRKKVLKAAKGFKWGRKSKYRLAKDALSHAWQYAFRDRKAKKRSFRQLWQANIGAASRAEGISYSRLISQLKQHKIGLDRKILAKIAAERPTVFQKIVEEAKK